MNAHKMTSLIMIIYKTLNIYSCPEKGAHQSAEFFISLLSQIDFADEAKPLGKTQNGDEAEHVDKFRGDDSCAFTEHRHQYDKSYTNSPSPRAQAATETADILRVKDSRVKKCEE